MQAIKKVVRLYLLDRMAMFGVLGGFLLIVALYETFTPLDDGVGTAAIIFIWILAAISVSVAFLLAHLRAKLQ